jgi:hypothetical protein
MESFYIDGVNYLVSGGIWGGDVYNGSHLSVSSSLSPNGAPSALKMNIYSARSVILEWTNGSTNEDGFSIEASLDNMTFNEIGVMPSGSTKWHGVDITTPYLYYYRIRAFKQTNFSNYSETVSIAFINDGHTKMWYDSQDLTTITRTSANLVSVWADKLLSGNNLLSDSLALYPTWNADGILFDGIDDNMKTAVATLTQPTFIYIVFKQVTWTNQDRIFDGHVNNSGILVQNTSTPNINVYAGSIGTDSDKLALDTWGIVRVLFNGANSKFIVNNEAPITGNFGASDMGRFRLASQGASGGTYFANIHVKEIIIRNVDESGANEAIIYNYLKNKHGI